MNIVIIGDSISHGLGKQKINYEESLKKELSEQYKLESNIFNLSETGKTIEYVQGIINKVDDLKPDLIIIALGSVDALMRPKPDGKIWKIVPKRYKKNGYLDPIPFYSHNFFRSCVQHIDSNFRWRLKLLLMKLCGKYCWVNKDIFSMLYSETISHFRKYKIVAITTSYVDEKFFPGSNNNLYSYSEEIKAICSNQQNISVFDLYNLEKNFVQTGGWTGFFYQDHFHPNSNGYSIIAKGVSKKIHDLYM